MTDPSRLSQIQSIANDGRGERCIVALRRAQLLAQPSAYGNSGTKVSILESSGADTLEKRQFLDEQSLLAHLNAKAAPRLRIISIFQEDSYEPLQIDQAGLEAIIRTHNVASEFLEVLGAAGSPPNLDSEEGFGQPLRRGFDGQDWMIAYLSRYQEQREGSWRLRQTGVYHCHEQSKGSDVFILLHPREDSTLQQSMEGLIHDPAAVTEWFDCPVSLHKLFFDSYLVNWRLFLREQGDRFQEASEKLYGLRLDDRPVHVDSQGLQWWRDFEDRLLPLECVLLGTREVLKALSKLDARIAGRQIDDLGIFTAKMGLAKALQDSIAGLRRRSHGALSLFRDALELKNQQELAAINQGLLILQEKNVDDSDTVRIITVYTLIYLPGMFVASLFGSNLFGLDDNSAKMRMADNIWWYFVLFVPLTLVTVGGWVLQTRSSSRKNRSLRRARTRLANPQP